MSRAGEHESTQIPPLLAPMLLSLGAFRVQQKTGCPFSKIFQIVLQQLTGFSPSLMIGRPSDLMATTLSG